MRFLLELAVATAAVAFLQPVAYAQGGGSACQRSAFDMRQACQADLHDNFSVGIANCRQLDAAADRSECWHDTFAQRSEDRQTCQDQLEARRAACELLGENRYQDPLIDPAIDFIDPDDIPDAYPNNPFVGLQTGLTYVSEADEEIGVVYVSDETREINGVQCRVVVDAAVEAGEDEEGDFEYQPVEVTDDWYAQDTDANVYYCGELSRSFEDGVLRELDGSFESGRDFASGGVLALAVPAVMDVHRQEYALGEAEDIVQYVALQASPSGAEGGENEAFPCAGNCLKTFEFAPLEPDSSEFKYYLPGLGFVLAVELEDGEITGEREALVCHGDSLDVLADPSCGIEHPAALREALCEQHAAFCEDDGDEED